MRKLKQNITKTIKRYNHIKSINYLNRYYSIDFVQVFILNFTLCQRYKYYF